MTKDEAMKLALEALKSELRDVLGYYRETFKAEPKCNPHPDAPHGFNRDASHNLGRYVCECEGWDPPEQEPVAWLDTFTDEVYSNSELDEEAKKDLAPIYTAPPKREWQGLTDEEILNTADFFGSFQYGDAQGHKRLEFARAIEAKLRAKNGF